MLINGWKRRFQRYRRFGDGQPVNPCAAQRLHVCDEARRAI
jgi:hypothetical protein